MNKILDVYLHDKKVGVLIQDKYGEIQFTYSSSWLDAPSASAISCSLPLQKQTFTQKQCSAFFKGILPEQSQRKLIAKNLGISANNDFMMLDRIGGECAGAITFLPASETLPKVNSSNYHFLTDDSLASILHELPYRPLLAGEKGVRLSLAGVQDKIAVCERNGKIAIPLDGAPSTHILKPALGLYDGIIFNEALCLALAEKVGLPTASATINKVGDVDYLLVKRYDREILNDEIKRLHQEDFCQALGIVPDKKYQNEGGPSFKQGFHLLRQVSDTPVIDLNHLMDAAIFNVLIGNCDAHGKNFSLLYQGKIRLAPLYDLVCTLYYKNLSTHMAMKLGGQYQANKIELKHFELLAAEVGLASATVKKRVLNLADAVMASLKAMTMRNQIEEDIAELIVARCMRVST